MRSHPLVMLVMFVMACRTPGELVDTGAWREWTDRDHDGFVAADDCDDNDPNVNPDAIETCNGWDDDCDAEIDEGLLVTFFADADGDSFGDPAARIEACELPEGAVKDASDCDDGDADVFPAAPERCDGVD